MRDNGIRDTINTLIETDPACLDKAELKARLALWRHVQGWAAAGVMADTRQLQRLAEQAHSPCPSGDAANALSTELDQTNGEAQSTVDQAGLLDANTGIHDSLASGKTTPRHVALIAKYRKRLTHEERSDFDHELDAINGWARTRHLKYFEQSLQELVAKIRAAHQPDDDGEAELERQRQHSGMRDWVDRDTGLHKYLLTMDPIRAAKFHSAVQAELAALRNQNQTTTTDTFGSLQIQALINAVSGGRAAARSTELVIIVDHATLTDGRHDNSVCETLDGDRLPVPTVQKLAQDAVVTLLAADDSGQITKAVDQRTATRQQRRALASLYRTCAFPECTAPFSHTRMHHIEYYSQGGETKLSNLIPICEPHHHDLHDRGWTLRIDHDRIATFTTPTGDTTNQTHPDRQPKPARAGP